jgi:hypothetical protein
MMVMQILHHLGVLEARAPDYIVATRARFVEINRCRWRLAPLDCTAAQTSERTLPMPDVTVVYWRDIPAQVIVGKGRRGAKAPLPERFEQAIDRCAMKVGAKDEDAYMASWRKAAPYNVDGEPGEVAKAEAARLDAEYDADRIKALIANDGHDG